MKSATPKCLLWLALLILAGCGDDQSDSAAPDFRLKVDRSVDKSVAKKSENGIDWYVGTVEAAFAAAKES